MVREGQEARGNSSDMTRMLRAAMVACGGVSNLTLRAARRSPDFEVAAIQDPDPAALERVGERYGIERRHTTLDEVLTDDIDFVVINSPNHLHLEHVRRAAAARKPCLVQKPLAPSLAEAAEIVRTASEHRVPLGVTMFELSKPLHHEVKSMVRSGWLGHPGLVQAVNAHTNFLENPPPPFDWRRDPDRVGGGAFIQLAVHHVNLAGWILGQEVVRVSATGLSGRTVFEDETTTATLVFDGDTVGTFAASYAADLYGFTLIGTRGRLHLHPDHVVIRGLDPYAGELIDYRNAGQETVIPLASIADTIHRLEPEVEVHGRFARWIAHGEPYPCPGERGLEDMKVVDAVYRSRRTGETLTLTR